MKSIGSHVVSRPRLFISAGAGLVAGLAATDIGNVVTRALVGWNVGVWLFLAIMGTMMLRANHARLRRTAAGHAEGAAVVLAVVVIAALVSLGGIVAELSAAKAASAHHRLPHVLLALATVTGSWLLVPTLFTLNYASLYFHHPVGPGLKFPDQEAGFAPDFTDFLYFAFTIAVASQTSDVSITTREMRRLVLLQSLLSFVFNTTILALTINIAASLF